MDYYASNVADDLGYEIQFVTDISFSSKEIIEVLQETIVFVRQFLRSCHMKQNSTIFKQVSS